MSAVARRQRIRTKILVIGVCLFAFLYAFGAHAQTPTSGEMLGVLERSIQEIEIQIAVLQARLTEARGALERAKKEQVPPIPQEQNIPSITRTLAIGSRGDDVRELQKFLSQFPDLYPEKLQTGFYGPLTAAAVRKFQERHGIEAVGNIGPKTLSKINDLLTTGAGKSGVVPPGLAIAPGILKQTATTTATTTSQTAENLCAKDSQYCATEKECKAKNFYWYTVSCHKNPPLIYSCAESYSYCINPTECSKNGWYWCRNSCYPTIEGCQGQTYVAPATPVVPAIPAQPIAQTGTTTVPAVPATSATTTATTTPTTSPPPPTSAGATISHTCGSGMYVPQETQSIQTALNSVCSGDTVYVSSGTYYENLSIPRSGITLKGASGTTAETVIIDGGGKGNVVFATGIKNFTIDGFTLRNASQSNNDNCGLISSPCSSGIYFINPPNNDVGTIIIRNLIVKKNMYGVWIAGMLAGNVTLERNVIVENQDSAVSTSGCGSSSAVVTNNTIANNGGYYVYLDGCGNRILRNNIIAKNSGFGVVLHQNTQRTISYNNVWGNTRGNYYQTSATSPLSPFTPSPGTGELSADPKFVSTTDYHLQGSSPAINAGDPFLTDPDGSRSDMGAYAYAGTVTTTTTTSAMSSTSTPSSTVPVSPSNLTYSRSNNNATVNLSWTDFSANETRYEILKRVSGSFVVIGQVGANVISFSETPPAGTYDYVVRACNDAGCSSSPPPVTVVVGASTSDTTPPSIPTGLHLYYPSSGYSSVNLEWNPSTDNVGVAGYKVYQNGVFIVDTGGAAYNTKVNNLSDGYSYAVAAYDGAGNLSAQSISVSVTTSSTGTTAENTCSNFTLTLSGNKTTFAVGDVIYVSYTCPSVITVHAEIVKPDGTAVNIGSHTASSGIDGFDTRSSLPGNYSARVCYGTYMPSASVSCQSIAATVPFTLTSISSAPSTTTSTTTATTTSLQKRKENLAAISEVVGSLNAALDALIQLLKRF